jgi:N-glycosylase/DNA lyase
LKASPGQLLLPLTISNKCGQSFRWRAVKVRDIQRQAVIDVKIEQNGDHSASTSRIKTEPGLEDLTSQNSVRPPSPSGATQLEWTEYSFCLPDRVVFVRQDEERGYIYHRTLLPPGVPSETPSAVASEETALWLSSYLNLSVPLEELYEEWSARDPIFARFAQKFQGVRMLRQDPFECLCSFICSSNNNIARIGGMVQNLCTHFSPKLTDYTYGSDILSSPVKKEEEAEEASDLLPMTIDYHPFPSPQALAQDGVEEKLRQLGFGYRAKYIHQTAKMLCEEHTRPIQDDEHGVDAILREIKEAAAGVALSKADALPAADIPSSNTPSMSQHSVHSYLASLRKMPYSESRSHLLRFQGVGPKVADCILLMSLDQPSSIPVDRHVFQFAARHYHLRSKEQIKYDNIVEFFRALWGEWAGWAHTILFVGDLRSFKEYDGGVKKEEEAGGDDSAVELKQDAASPITPLVKVEEEVSTIIDEDPRRLQDSKTVNGRAATGGRAVRVDSSFRAVKSGSPVAAGRKRKAAAAAGAEGQETLTLAERVKARSNR